MILITTAGKVGTHAARLLAAEGQAVRIVVRNPSAHEGLAAAGIELFHGDLDRADSIAEAVAGVDTVVLVTPAVPAQEIAVIEAARGAGVGHIVKVTSDAAPDSPISRRRDHHRIEQALLASGIPHTLLRANAYLQNLLALAPGIVSTSTFASAAGDGRIGMVDARDVAAVAAVVAAHPADHVGTSYRLSGPASVSYDDVAARLGTLLGRPVTHRHITKDEQEAALIGSGLLASVARANALALTLFAAGDSDWTSPDVERITGHEPVGLAEFLARELPAFRESSPRVQGARQPGGAQ
jgi:uncharacterized protein YbjT (DUF2867 family)